MNIFIFANCHGAIYKQALIDHLAPGSFTVEHVVSYENLENYAVLQEKFAACDVLVIQPVTNYEDFRLENLRKILKPNCQVIRVPFMRFEGFWIEGDIRTLNNISSAAVDFFPNIAAQHQVSNYLSGRDLDTGAIRKSFDRSVAFLRALEQTGDIRFVDFFMDHYKKVPLLRDSYHPTSPFYRHVTMQIISHVIARNPQLDAGKDKSVNMHVGIEYGHFKPIRDKVADVLELEYNLDSYFFCSREDYLRGVLWSEQHATGNVTDFTQLQKLFKSYFQQKPVIVTS